MEIVLFFPRNETCNVTTLFSALLLSLHRTKLWLEHGSNQFTSATNLKLIAVHLQCLFQETTVLKHRYCGSNCCSYYYVIG